MLVGLGLLPRLGNGRLMGSRPALAQLLISGLLLSVAGTLRRLSFTKCRLCGLARVARARRAAQPVRCLGSTVLGRVQLTLLLLARVLSCVIVSH